MSAQSTSSRRPQPASTASAALGVRRLRFAAAAAFFAAGLLAPPVAYAADPGMGTLMVRTTPVAAPTSISIGPAPAAPTTPPATTSPIVRGTPAFAPGYILVGPKAGTPDAVVAQVLAEHGGRSLGKLGKLNVHMVEVPLGLEADAAARLAKNPHIRFAEVDRLVPPTATANDPLFGSE